MIQQTSLKAYESIKDRLGEKQIKVLQILQINRIPLTNGEIAKLLGWSINRVTPRIFELRQRKCVINADKRNCKVTNRLCLTWKDVKPKTEMNENE